MSIKLECKNCKQALEAESSMVGQRLACPNCNTPIVIPFKVKKEGDIKSKPVVKTHKNARSKKLLVLIVIISVIAVGLYASYKKDLLPDSIHTVIQRHIPPIIGNEGQQLTHSSYDLEIIIDKTEMKETSKPSDQMRVSIYGRVKNAGKTTSDFGLQNKYLFDKGLRAFPCPSASRQEDLRLDPLESSEFSLQYVLPKTADLSILYWGLMNGSRIRYLIKTNLSYEKYQKLKADEVRRHEEELERIREEREKLKDTPYAKWYGYGFSCGKKATVSAWTNAISLDPNDSKGMVGYNGNSKKSYEAFEKGWKDALSRNTPQFPSLESPPETDAY